MRKSLAFATGVIVERIGSLPRCATPSGSIAEAQRTAESGVGTELRLASGSIPDNQRRSITEDPEFLRVDFRTLDRAAYGPN